MTDPSELVDFYLRLSVDREGKDSLERQEADLRVWAASEGLTVRKVWKDAGKSGYKKNVVRAAFDGAVEALEAGEVGTLAVWKLDRLSRRGAGQVGLVLDQIEDRGGRIYFLQDRLDSRHARSMILFVSEQARTESANTVLRVTNKIAGDAVKGIPKRGTRSFGWEVDGMTIRESEAVHVRMAVRDYLEGTRSLLQIAKAWNEAGIKTDGMTRPRRRRGDDPDEGQKAPLYSYWTATTVRQVLQRPRNAGLLVHHGAELESQIQPIITRAELEQIRGRVKLGTPVGARAKSFLGGILRCECGAPMHSTVSYSQRKGGPRREYRVYKCSQTLYDKSRRHASIQEHIADSAVSLQVLSYLALGVVKAEEAPEWGAQLVELADRLTVLEAQEIRAEDALVEGLGNKARMEARLRGIRAERLELTAERDRLEAERVGGNVFRVIEQMQEVLVAVAWGPDTPLDGLEEWALQSVLDAWSDLPLEDVQALIRGRFSVSVRVGGRGSHRVSVDPR